MNSVSTIDLATSYFPTVGGDLKGWCKLAEFNNYNTITSIKTMYVLNVMTAYGEKFINSKYLLYVNSNEPTQTKLYCEKLNDIFTIGYLQNDKTVAIYGKVKENYAQINMQVLTGDLSNVILYKNSKFNLNVEPIEPIQYNEPLTIDNIRLLKDNGNALSLLEFGRKIYDRIKFGDIFYSSDDEFVIAYRGQGNVGNSDYTKIKLKQSDIEVLLQAGGGFNPTRSGSNNLGSENNIWKNGYFSESVFCGSTVYKIVDNLPTSPKDGETVVHRATHKLVTYHQNASNWYDCMGNSFTV